ncbi:hypothetical protein BJV74DRAFT_800179 [Russula compacta]|nr:hypothetical protein BJV74DRAFT_800179 [Russula compacta]
MQLLPALPDLGMFFPDHFDINDNDNDNNASFNNSAIKVIVIDNNSLDGTQEVAKQLAATHSEDKIVLKPCAGKLGLIRTLHFLQYRKTKFIPQLIQLPCLKQTLVASMVRTLSAYWLVKSIVLDAGRVLWGRPRVVEQLHSKMSYACSSTFAFSHSNNYAGMVYCSSRSPSAHYYEHIPQLQGTALQDYEQYVWESFSCKLHQCQGFHVKLAERWVVRNITMVSSLLVLLLVIPNA